MARAGLSCLAAAYHLAIAAWGFYHNHWARPAHAAVPVISVGNISIGGSGKTPAVMELADRLARLDRRVGILIRGYAGGQRADEVQLLRRRCPQSAVFVNSDRVSAAGEACHAGCDVLIMDDGFQHRRQARDLDIVLLDATCPFGMGHLLPRGLLREPPNALRRADLVVLTRCDQVDALALQRTEQRLAELVAPSTPVLHACHRPAGLVDPLGKDAGPLPGPGGRAVLASAIGCPAAFERTVAGLGLQVLAHRAWPDHHRFTREDVAVLGELHSAHQPDWLLTTEKDAVKWQQLSLPADLPLRALRVRFDFAPGEDTMLTRRLEQLLSQPGRGTHGQTLPPD